MVTDEQIQEIVRLIEVNFENTIYPGDDNIGVHHIEKGFMGKRWQDITLQLLLSHRDELGSLTSDAFRYYLPAFLLGILQFNKNLDSFPENFIPLIIPLLSPLDKYSYPSDDRLFIALDSLSKEQKMAVGTCLKIIAEVYQDNDDTIPLAPAIRYWSQYVP